MALQATQVSCEVAGRTLTIETGKLAEQAGGAVTVRYGDTLILATATASKEPRLGTDFFPLTVDYEQRHYASGKIPGGYPRREGRPSDDAILMCRLTDRPLRPLFPKGYRNDVQVIVYVLSADLENAPDTMGIIGASTALMISDIPFAGPIAAVRMGYIDGKVVANPLMTEVDEQSKLDLVVAGTADAIMMVEAGANEVSEAVILEALEAAQQVIKDIVAIQEQLAEKVGKTKQQFEPPTIDPQVQEAVETELQDRLAAVLNQKDKTTREEGLEQLSQEIVGKLEPQYPADQIVSCVEQNIKQAVRTQIIEQDVRPDGRDSRTIRPISIEVGTLPRTHGSAVFTRGQTQALSVVTLGSPGDAQRLDGLAWEDVVKRYMHHYFFPPFSTGEARFLRGPSRRDIGHGRLAERAIMPMLPSEEEFGYTIRVVSELLSSNGSTSMASVCGSSLSLLDAGVPLKQPVAGVAMGLMLGDDGQYKVLTDIQGMEDFLGDMDFKVAGTTAGITALQMDIKVTGITTEIMREALAQAQQGRLFILEKMQEALPAPRSQLSSYAPRMITVSINPEKIGAVIGPGGKTIRGLEAQTGADINIDDKGLISILSPSAEGAEKAEALIREMTEEVEVGRIYLGKVVRLMNFGAFAELPVGTDGLIPLEELAEHPVSRAEEVVEIGDEVMVMVSEVDSQGRVNLSRRAVVEGGTPQDVMRRKSQRVRQGGPGGPGRPRPRGGATPATAYGSRRQGGDQPTRPTGVRRRR
jgi:polyribonucleotide nucleotidyltransferase